MTHAGKPYRFAFREWFGLRPAEAGLLVALYQASGAPRTNTALAAQAGVHVGAMTVHITRLRAALESEALDWERGVGYRLTEVGLAECRGALWTMGEELRGAA